MNNFITWLGLKKAKKEILKSYKYKDSGLYERKELKEKQIKKKFDHYLSSKNHNLELKNILWLRI